MATRIPVLSLYGASFIIPKSSVTALNKNKPYNYQRIHFRSCRRLPFWPTLSFPDGRNFRVSAQFSRRTAYRRNSLRKKLIDEQQQVRQNQIKLDSFSNLVENENSELYLISDSGGKSRDHVGENELVSDTSDLALRKDLEDSSLRNKLESWVEQYKEDIDFWGIGSGSIFTVFQDSSGNVERVLVDEDEILRRSGIDPSYFRTHREELEEFVGVNLKISHANFLSKEMESGRNLLPKNSSVAKFVVSGESLGFASGIRRAFMKPGSLPKISKIGFAVFCGFLLMWAVKKFFSTGEDKEELTRFEKEMLRRKIKSRMEKDKLKKGSVEVIQNPEDPPTVITERPRLNKEKMMNSIRTSNASNNEMCMPDISVIKNAKPMDMDARIQQIRIMARHAREIENGLHSPTDRVVEKKEVSSKLSVQKEAVEAHLCVEEYGLKKQDAKEQSLAEVESDIQHEEEDANHPNDFHDSDLSESMVFDGVQETTTLKILDIGDAELTDDTVPAGSNAIQSSCTSNGKGEKDEKVGTLDAKAHDAYLDIPELGDKDNCSSISSSRSSMMKKAPARSKPRVILTAKEARDYLSRKHDNTLADGYLPSHVAQNCYSPIKKAEATKGIHNSGSQRYMENEISSFQSSISGKTDLNPNINGYEYPCAKDCESDPADINVLDGAAHHNTVQSAIARQVENDKTNLDAGVHLDTQNELNEKFWTAVPVESLDTKDDGNVVDISFIEEKKSHSFAADCSARADDMDETVQSSERFELIPAKSAANVSQLLETGFVKTQVNYSLQNHAEDALSTAETSQDSESSEGSADIEHERSLQTHAEDALSSAETSQDSESSEGSADIKHERSKGNWLEKNFHELDPIVEKMGVGFRNSYAMARDKVNQELDLGTDITKLMDGNELEWMNDEKLRGIVFQVRDNELAGRDPFHTMDAEDKIAFFKGLERKVEKENEKLSALHDWLHSNIENLDYGADGISLYDPPDKIIPRWKGPPIDKIHEFLSSIEKQNKAFIQKEEKTPLQQNVTTQEVSMKKSIHQKNSSKGSRTVIEGSDGSVKPGKKSGKEYWQHTKKWSRGFLESYTTETDPEVKATMKDMGKDLDRWITEKEIKEAADLMDNVPQRSKEFMEKKLNKLKREMELFGPQAVVSKYREYTEEKEEDYLWWLDLPYVLCIELYTYEGEDLKVGFYSLEMAGDLEIEPKPYHVIAFENPVDCKNLCYIIQAHMEMLGNGRAFVVSQPPKDAFRQAKDNGFGVTVVRKGELQLNVDQPLEEVEENIVEIGSKVYHDAIMKERSVDISSLMKGVFGVSKSTRKRLKRRRKRRNKQ